MTTALDVATDSSAPSAGRRIRHLMEYGLFATVRSCLRLSPDSAPRRVASLLGRVGYRLDRKHRRVALDNLQMAMPELSDEERERVACLSFQNFSTALLEMIATAPLSGETYAQRIEVQGWEHLEEAERAGRGILVMTAHLGNWEATAQFMALQGRPISFVAREQENPYLEAEVRRIRERFGNSTIFKRAGAKAILKSLRNQGRVGLLMDQRVHPNEGKAYRFFGHPAYTSPLLASLSLHTGAPVVPGFGLPLDSWRRCRIVIREPIFPDVEGPQAADELTLRYLEVLEAEIRQHPELWLWVHRRWRKNPTRRPKRRIPRMAAGPESTEVIDRGSLKRSGGSEQRQE